MKGWKITFEWPNEYQRLCNLIFFMILFLASYIAQNSQWGIWLALAIAFGVIEVEPKQTDKTP